MNVSAGLLAPGSRRIPAVAWRASEAARQIELEARRAAEALTASARAGAEAVRAEAYDAGRQEGLASASELLVAAAYRRDAVIAQSERELAELAFEIARRVLEHAAERDRALVVELARRALDASRRRREVVLRAHPRDVAALRDAEPELVARLAHCPRIAFLEDEAIARGGVVLETEAGLIDAQLQPQLDALRRAVLGATGEGP